MAVDPNETRRQRVNDAISDIGVRSWTRGQFTFTISDRYIRQLGGQPVLSVVLRVNRNGTVLFDDRINMPNPAVGIRNPDNTITDNPLQALRDTLLDVVNAMTADGRTPHLRANPDGTFQGDTLAVRANTTDGEVVSSNATFATMATGSGLVAFTTRTNVTLRWSNTGVNYQGRMAFIEYDTSTIGAGSTITAAVHTLYGNGVANTNGDSYQVVARYKDWGGTVTTAEWFDPRGVWTGLTFGGLKTVSSFSGVAGTANNLSDSAIYTDIQQTGTTRIVVGYSGMNAATPTGINEVNFRLADQSGTTSDPLLTVTYTVGSTGAGASTRGAAIAAGVGAARWIGSGASTRGAAIATGVGKSRWVASGAAVRGAAVAVGVGKARWVGSGAATRGAAVASGTGTFGSPIAAGVGIATRGAAVATGVGKSRWVASGAATRGAAVAIGAGHFTMSVGAGAATRGAAIAAGVGKARWVASGAATRGPAVAVGVGNARWVASGAATRGAAVAVGAGSYFTARGQGAAVRGAAIAIGVGKARWIASGAATRGAAVAVGVGRSRWIGSGSATRGAAVANGIGVYTAARGVGVAVRGPAVAVGVGRARWIGVGASTRGAAIAVGVGFHFVRMFAFIDLLARDATYIDLMARDAAIIGLWARSAAAADLAAHDAPAVDGVARDAADLALEAVDAR